MIVEGVQQYVTPGAYLTLPGSRSNTPQFSWREIQVPGELPDMNPQTPNTHKNILPLHTPKRPERYKL